MTTSSDCGRYFLVAPDAPGAAAFVGRALAEDAAGLVGRAVRRRPDGSFAAEPFLTRIGRRAGEPGEGARRIEDPDAADEAERLLAAGAQRVERDELPLLLRWLEDAPAAAADELPWDRHLERFAGAAHELRDALYRGLHVGATGDLDRLAELEGDLVIELGKAANGLAVRLNRLALAEPDLARALEQAGGGAAGPADALAGPRALYARLETARRHARRAARSDLARDVSALLRELSGRVDALVLEHAGALDALIAEARGPAPAPRREEPAGGRSGRRAERCAGETAAVG